MGDDMDGGADLADVVNAEEKDEDSDEESSSKDTSETWQGSFDQK